MLTLVYVQPIQGTQITDFINAIHPHEILGVREGAVIVGVNASHKNCVDVVQKALTFAEISATVSPAAKSQTDIKNLKEVLMILGNRLVTERGFVPNSTEPSNQSFSTKPIVEFTEWLNNQPEARGFLADMGINFPVVKQNPSALDLLEELLSMSETDCPTRYRKRWQEISALAADIRETT